MATQTFSLVPEFSYIIVPQYSTLATRFEDGTVQLRAKYAKTRRAWKLRWDNATPDEAEELQALFADMRGAAGEFYYVPSQKVLRPYSAPTMGQTAGGALGARTRYAVFTWSDGTYETTEALNYGTLAVGSGYLLTVTVPAFPSGVTQANVYVGATTALYYEQATPISTSAGTWTEPTGGYATGTDTPPTTNGLSETVTAHFAEDQIELSKNSAYAYSMAVVIEELP